MKLFSLRSTTLRRYELHGEGKWGLRRQICHYIRLCISNGDSALEECFAGRCESSRVLRIASYNELFVNRLHTLL